MPTFKIKNNIRTSLFRNSFWGIVTNIIQTLFFSIFFVLISRNFTVSEFGSYLVVNSLYATLVGFSNLGLGNWFTREYLETKSKSDLIKKFIIIQFVSGVLFYGFQIVLTFSLYSSPLIHHLSFLIGLNILLDNLFYVIKTVNITKSKQIINFYIFSIESLSKLFIILLIFIYPITIFQICLFVLITRVLLMFVLYNKLLLKPDWVSIVANNKEKKVELINLIRQNWPFIVISSLAILNWRMASILISKFMKYEDLANFEIAFKLLSIAYLLPVIFIQSSYPLLISAYKNGILIFRKHYYNLFYILAIYGALAYSFVFFFSDSILPLLFGKNYYEAVHATKLMFLVILFFPVIYLQANVMLVMHLEKVDMYFNFINLFLTTSMVILMLVTGHSLPYIILSIVTSFFVFILLQDMILIKNKIINWKDPAIFYVFNISIVLFNYFISGISSVFIYLIISLIFLLILVIKVSNIKKYFKYNHIN